jgi:YbbR domain-containing protein
VGEGEGVKFLTMNWELKLLSLLFAILLWGFVVGGERADMVLPVSVEFLGVPPGLELTAESVDIVNVQVRGLRGQLTRLKPEFLRAQVVLAGTRSGESAVRLLPEHVRVPAGIQVVRITPSRVRVVLEAVESARVKVVPRLTGSPPPGFVLKDVAVSPPEVQVRGPQSEVRQLTQVETEPVDLSALRAPLRRSLALVGPGGSVTLVSERTVEVVLEVVERGS